MLLNRYLNKNLDHVLLLINSVTSHKLIVLWIYCHFLTRPHSAPSSVATIVAARGVLYMSASSPKLPLLLY